jgi:phytoene synthase
MSAAAAPADGVALCAEAVRAQDFPAYAATLFTDPPTRRGLLALHAFAGEVARVRDHVSQPLPGEIRLQWWADTLSGQDHGGVEGNPVAAEIKRAIAAFDLPMAELSRIIEAWRAELYNEPVADLAALENFLTETSSALLRLAVRICAPAADVPADLVRQAGLAQGLVQLIVDVPREAARGRLLLPRDLLALNGVAADDILSGRPSAGLAAVLAYLAGEAERRLSRVGTPPAALRPALLPLALARKTLAEARRLEFDPFRLAPASRLSVLWTYWRAGRSFLS